MVRIVNWLLTRRCNLQCSYCRIAYPYNKPEEYPPFDYFVKSEMKTEKVIELLEKFKKHNPNCFHIFYGGEPFLRNDLSDIIQFCHDNEIFYTIITNNTEGIQKRIEKLFSEVGFLYGLTSSVDPVIFSKGVSSDIVKKSLAGLDRLFQFRNQVKDLVAEVTVDKTNIVYLVDLVRELKEKDICPSITFIDIAKNDYYDFSNVTDESVLVTKEDALQPLNSILDEFYDFIHMGEKVLSKIYNSLPSDLDCEIERGVHNITIDSDGSFRLCLRIRGIETPRQSLKEEVIDKSGNLNPELVEWISKDKQKICNKCNWTCMLFSKEVEENEKEVSNLVHFRKRGLV